MASELSKAQWSEILIRPDLTKEVDLSIFQILYAFDKHRAYASQVGSLLGYGSKSPHSLVNLEIGRYAKRIAKFYDAEFTKRSQTKEKYWDFFFYGWWEGRYFVWQLKPEIVAALEENQLTGEKPYAEEIPATQDMLLVEGLKKTVIVNSYERNAKAREICISHWGCVCIVCGFDFQKTYGDIGKGFIHVHHLIPLSEIGVMYHVNPINDLRPICPNCHAMLHKFNPPLTIEKLKEIINNKGI